MINILRKNRNWLWFVILFLSIPFIFYFVQQPDYGAMKSSDFGQIYGRKISDVEFYRNVRMFELARDLGMFNFLQELAFGGQTEKEAHAKFAVNLIILKHEAERLGIRPNPAEIAETVKGFRAFHGESGAFDIKRYTEFAENALGPSGFTETQIEELAGDEIRLKRIKELLMAGVHVSETEIRSNYEQAYGKNDVAVIRFRSADLTKEVNISDDDIAKYYETHKAELKSEEKRKIEFVSLTLNEEEKKLTGKERIDALQKLANRTTDLTQALFEQKNDFRAMAEKLQLAIVPTDEFTRATPDPKLSADPQLATAAFQLSRQEPNSDAIQTADGFYVLHLVDVAESRPLTLEEAKPKIIETLKTTRLSQLVQTKGAATAHMLRESVRAGEPLEAAAQKAGLKLEKLPPFSLVDDEEPKPPDPAKPDEPPQPKPEAPDMPMIKNALASISPGDISEFVPTQDGGLIAVLQKREKPDEAKYEQKKAVFENRFRRGKQQLVFIEWLRERQDAAGVKLSQS